MDVCRAISALRASAIDMTRTPSLGENDRKAARLGNRHLQNISEDVTHTGG